MHHDPWNNFRLAWAFIVAGFLFLWLFNRGWINRDPRPWKGGRR